MPEMDGLTAIKILREKIPDIQIPAFVALTATTPIVVVRIISFALKHV